MNAIKPILNAYQEGHAALLISGRSLYDFVTDEGRIRPLFEVMRRTLFREYGMVLITYSIANGLNWFESWIINEQDKRVVRSLLESSSLLNLPRNENETVAVIRGMTTLSRTNTEKLKWHDNSQMRFALCCEFTEHLAPGSLTNGTQTDAQLIVSELVHITSQSLALRDSGNLIIFHGRDGLIDELVCGALKHVHLPQPNKEEKQEFVATALDLYSEATFEDGLSEENIVALTVNTPNRGLEGLLRASHRGGRAVTAGEISEQKKRDVEQLSEGTLSSLDTSRVKNLCLVGRNIAVPLKILRQLAECLILSDATMPANVLLAGAPGTAKTDLALLVAHEGQAPAYQMFSPKGSLVGETERKARLQQQALKESVPNVAFSDEITEAFPLERSEFDGDSGATRAVSAALLTALSDESRRGQSLLIATTNRVWAMSAAMRSRFTVIPVLFPLREDFPGIIAATAKRISPATKIDPSDSIIKRAGEIFYAKGANPRHIRAALSNVLLLKRVADFSPADILFAAEDLCATTDFISTIYADLWAIKCCSSRSFLPWSGDAKDYQFPEYLNGIVNPTSGEIDETALNKKLEELKPYASV